MDKDSAENGRNLCGCQTTLVRKYMTLKKYLTLCIIISPWKVKEGLQFSYTYLIITVFHNWNLRKITVIVNQHY